MKIAAKKYWSRWQKNGILDPGSEIFWTCRRQFFAHIGDNLFSDQLLDTNIKIGTASVTFIILKFSPAPSAPKKHKWLNVNLLLKLMFENWPFYAFLDIETPAKSSNYEDKTKNTTEKDVKWVCFGGLFADIFWHLLPFSRYSWSCSSSKY